MNHTTIINPPLIITARLMAGMVVGTGTLSIEAIERDHEGRLVYRYAIDAPGLTYVKRDMRSGCNEQWDPKRAVEALLAYLDAVVGTERGDDNFTLFPKRVREWANANGDEIQMARLDLEDPEA